MKSVARWGLLMLALCACASLALAGNESMIQGLDNARSRLDRHDVSGAISALDGLSPALKSNRDAHRNVRFVRTELARGEVTNGKHLLDELLSSLRPARFRPGPVVQPGHRHNPHHPPPPGNWQYDYNQGYSFGYQWGRIDGARHQWNFYHDPYWNVRPRAFREGYTAGYRQGFREASAHPYPWPH